MAAGAINSRQKLTLRLSIAKLWLFTSSSPSPCLRTFVPHYPSITINIFSRRNLNFRPSSAVGVIQFSEVKKSDNNPILGWGEKTSSWNNFSMEGKKKNSEIWVELLQFSPRLLFCWLASDINVPSLFERNENEKKKKKKEFVFLEYRLWNILKL